MTRPRAFLSLSLSHALDHAHPRLVPERKKKPAVVMFLTTTRLGFLSPATLEGSSLGGGRDTAAVRGLKGGERGSGGQPVGWNRRRGGVAELAGEMLSLAWMDSRDGCRLWVARRGGSSLAADGGGGGVVGRG